MEHPKARPGISRRSLLGRAAGLAGVPLLGGLAAACSDTTEINAGKGSGTLGGGGSIPGVQLGSGGIPLARRDIPVSLRRYSKLHEIDSGLQPEKGPLKIYNWNQYIDPAATKAFGKLHGVDVQITEFTTMDEAYSKLSAGGLDFDVIFPTVARLTDFVSANLLLPLNHDYLPNLAKNVWPQLVNPYYDFGSHFTVPYVVYSVGIAWRNDKVHEDIAAMKNPWDALWNASAYKGKVALLDDDRDAFGSAMLSRGFTDINTGDPKVIAQALADLTKFSQTTAAKIQTGQYQDVPEGKIWLAHDWSGDMIAGALYYMPPGIKGDALSFWAPPQAQITNDTIAVLAGGKNPVLAHLFLDYLLDEKVAYDNMANFNGYQPPQNALDPATMVSRLGLPASLKDAIVTREAFETGLAANALTPEIDSEYQRAWAQLKAG